MLQIALKLLAKPKQSAKRMKQLRDANHEDDEDQGPAK